MVISIASQKGGTGKTSTSISLAAGLARKGKKVLLIDIDSQANSSKVLLANYPEIPKEETIYSTVLDRRGLVVHPTQVPNLSIVPSHILLSNTDIELTTAKDHREARLKAKLDRIKGGYDYVFIDNPPALGWLTLNAFTASDQALVVVAPGYFELDSLVQLSKTLEEHASVRAIVDRLILEHCREWSLPGRNTARATSGVSAEIDGGGENSLQDAA